MVQITDKGVAIDRLDAIHQRLSDGFKRIYGDDINIDADTPDGQMIGLFSQSLADLNQVIAFICNMLDPYQATGVWLEQRALYAGIVRRGADYSYINDAVVVGRANSTIAQYSVFIDSNNVRWVALNEVTLTSLGSARIDLRSEEPGAFELPAGSRLTLQTVVLGVESVTLTAAAQAGVEEETDGQLLTRFMRSHAINNHDDRQGIEAALLDQPDVKQAVVYENYTDQPDEKGLPAHTMNAVLIGGTDEDIALTILKKKVGGCGLMGEIVCAMPYQGAVREVRFDRAQPVAIAVHVVIQRIKDYQDIDVDGIKHAIAETAFDIGESVYATRLMCRVNVISGFYIKSLTVNDAQTVDVGWRQCARIAAEDVEVFIE